MTQLCAKSKAVEGINASIVVAKSKDYSIYSQVLEVIKKDLKNRVKVNLPHQLINQGVTHG